MRDPAGIYMGPSWSLTAAAHPASKSALFLAFLAFFSLLDAGEGAIADCADGTGIDVVSVAS